MIDKYTKDFFFQSGRDLLLCKKAKQTGFKKLDSILPNGGWPLEGVIEIFYPQANIGELKIFLPVITKSTQSDEKVILIDPPFLPYPPTLLSENVVLSNILIFKPDKEIKNRNVRIFNACNQLLLTKNFSYIFFWCKRLTFSQFRKLNLLTIKRNVLVILLSEIKSSLDSLPSKLKISLTTLSMSPSEREIDVRILKNRINSSIKCCRLRL